MGAAIDEVAEKTDALLYGRRTWEVMAGAWPERKGDPFADWINAADGAARPYDLVSSVTTSTGVQVCRYQRVR